MLDRTDLKTAVSNFNQIDSTGFCYLQDIFHIGTKLRNRVLAALVNLIMGSSIVSLSHLKILINDIPKEIHGLVMKDICRDDRQNYGSLEKMMQQRVSNALAEHVIGSQGTIMYLKLCEKITSSLTDEVLSPLERIQRLWYATFFFRSWRKWLQQTEIKLMYHFISHSAYTSIEINAANLIKLTRQFRDEQCEHLYIPTMFNSQPCEETFRVFRSMGTMNYTKINFTLLELFHLVGRVELQNDLVHIKLASQNISFPRNKISKTKLNQFKLPSDAEITKIIRDAKEMAIKDATKFGMKTNDIEECEINCTPQAAPGDIESDDEDIDTSHTQDPPNPLIEIMLENGTKKTIRKSHFLWTLTDSRQHLSNDRLKRVQETKANNKPDKQQPLSRRLVFRKELMAAPILTMKKYDELQIGDWCIFEIENNNKVVFVIGNVLSFRYKDGKSAKTKKYTWDFVPINAPKNVKPRGIEVMASWFHIGLTTDHSPMGVLNSFYIDIDKYIITMECKNIKLSDSGCLTFTNEITVLQHIHAKLSPLSKYSQK